MTSTFSFQPDKIKQSEQDFSKLKLAPDQIQIVEGVAKLLCRYIDMSELAMKGFISLMIKEWQVESRMSIAELSAAEPEIRLKNMHRMFMLLAEKLKSTLSKKNEEISIGNEIKKAWEYYKENFAFR
jgi:hypothetical protein